MKSVSSIVSFWIFTFCLFPLSADSFNSYQMPPSTGQDLPYSARYRSLLKKLFDNSKISGGQVIAISGFTGGDGRTNQIDLGDLAGVEKGEVLALFTPKGEPVGFIRITNLQRFTSSFEYLELTVDPATDLFVKKITTEIHRRLPKRYFSLMSPKRFSKPKLIASKPIVVVQPDYGKPPKPKEPILPPLPLNKPDFSPEASHPSLFLDVPPGSPSTLPSLPSDVAYSNSFPTQKVPPKGDMPPLPDGQFPSPQTIQRLGTTPSGVLDLPSLTLTPLSSR